MASHRVLTLSFEFHVPEGLPSNIRGARLNAAVAAITSAVQALAPGQFPWADRIVVRSEWAYRWSENTSDISLAPTSENTVVDGAAGVGTEPAAETEPAL